MWGHGCIIPCFLDYGLALYSMCPLTLKLWPKRRWRSVIWSGYQRSSAYQMWWSARPNRISIRCWQLERQMESHCIQETWAGRKGALTHGLLTRSMWYDPNWRMKWTSATIRKWEEFTDILEEQTAFVFRILTSYLLGLFFESSALKPEAEHSSKTLVNKFISQLRRLYPSFKAKRVTLIYLKAFIWLFV